MNLIQRMIKHALDSPRMALAISIAVLVFNGFGWQRLPIELNPYDAFQKSDPEHSRLKLLEENFDDDHSVTFIVRNEYAELTSREYCGLSHWAQAYGQTHAEVKSLSAPFFMRKPEHTGMHFGYPRRIAIDCDAPPETWPATWHEGWSELNRSMWAGIVTGHDANDLPIQIVFDNTRDGDGNVQVEFVKDAYESLHEWVATNFPALKVAMIGPSSFPLNLHEAMKSDSVVQGLIALVFIIFFRVFFGSWRASAYYLGTLAVTLAILFGFMGWLGQPVNILTNSLVLMTAIAGAEDFLFLSLMQKPRDRGDCFVALALPGFFTTLTTALGFWSLGFSHVKIIREFGIEAGLASFIEWFATFYCLPAFLKISTRDFSWVFPERVVWNLKPISVRRRLPRLVNLTLTLAPVVLIFVAFNRLNFDEDSTKSFPSGHIHTTSYEMLKKTRTWQTVIEVLFRPDPESLKADATLVESTLGSLGKVDGVLKVENPYAVIRDLDQGLDQDGVRLVEQDLPDSQLWKTYFAESGWTRARLYLKSESLAYLRPRIEQLENICHPPDCRLSGKILDYVEISKQIVPTLLESFWLSLVLVGIVIIWLARVKRVGFIIPLVLSAFWGPLIMLIGLWIFQVQINLVTSLFAAVIVGLTGDNAIQYIFAAESHDLKSGMDKMARGSILLAILLSFCGLTFVLQTPVALKTLGLLFFLAFGINWVGDFFVLSEWISVKRD
jgi:predicted RND superfamily exporter protein